MDLEDFGDLSSVFGVIQRRDLARSIGDAQRNLSDEISRGNRELVNLELQRNRLLERQRKEEANEKATRLESRKTLVSLKRKIRNIEADDAFDFFFQLAAIELQILRIEQNGCLETVDDFDSLDELKTSVQETAKEHFPDIENFVDTAYAHVIDINNVMGMLNKCLNSRRYLSPYLEPRIKPLILEMNQLRDAAHQKAQSASITRAMIELGYDIENGDLELAENANYYQSQKETVFEKTDADLMKLFSDYSNKDSIYLDLTFQPKSFFDSADLLCDELSFASLIEENSSAMESELRLIDSEASQLLKSEEATISKSFITFMEMVEVEPAFDYEESALLVDLLHRGKFGYESLKSRFNEIRSFIQEHDIDNILEEIRRHVSDLNFENALAKASELEETTSGTLDFEKLNSTLYDAQSSFREINSELVKLTKLNPSFKNRLFKGSMQEVINETLGKVVKLANDFPIETSKSSIREFITNQIHTCQESLKGFDLSLPDT